MVRRARVEIEGGVYHVYNRIASGEPVFSDPHEAVEFIENIRETKRRDGWKILAWCVMPNHYHLVLRTGTVPLWRGMHRVQNLYSRGFNRRHGRSGSLWQSRYKAKYVEDGSYLGKLVVYVHLNPVTAGVVDDPDEYVFGGHREIKRRLRSALVDVDEALLCFGTTKKEARRSYLSAVRTADAEDSEVVRSSWHPFTSSIDQDLEVDDTRPFVDVLGRSTDRERPRLDEAVFVSLVSDVLGISQETLCSRSRSRSIARVRRLVVTLGVERWRQNRTRLARVLQKNPDVLSWWASEGATLRHEDPEFAENLESADEKLSRRASTLSSSERRGVTS